MRLLLILILMVLAFAAGLILEPYFAHKMGWNSMLCKARISMGVGGVTQSGGVPGRPDGQVLRQPDGTYAIDEIEPPFLPDCERTAGKPLPPGSPNAPAEPAVPASAPPAP